MSGKPRGGELGLCLPEIMLAEPMLCPWRGDGGVLATRAPLPLVLGCDYHLLPYGLLINGKQKSGRAGIGVLWCQWGGCHPRAGPACLPRVVYCAEGARSGFRAQFVCKEEEDVS